MSSTSHAKDIPATTRPRSLRSVSSQSDANSGSPIALDPSTLALLNNFYEERAEAEDKFRKMEEAAHARLLKAQEGETGQQIQDQGNDVQEMISVDDFREMFGEDWQLSQFW